MTMTTPDFHNTDYLALLASHVGYLKGKNIYHGYEVEDYKRITYSLNAFKKALEDIRLTSTGDTLYHQYLSGGGTCPKLMLDALEADACAEGKYVYLDINKYTFKSIYLALWSFHLLVSETFGSDPQPPKSLLEGLHNILKESIDIVKNQETYSL